tara:strand:- start:303 stop:500 length:198 start_codon:yes stop_codon:yes gene_type:complete
MINGKALIKNRDYVVSGWASVNSEEEGLPIWDITKTYLSSIKNYDINDLQQPKIRFENDNFGIET